MARSPVGRRPTLAGLPYGFDHEGGAAGEPGAGSRWPGRPGAVEIRARALVPLLVLSGTSGGTVLSRDVSHTLLLFFFF